LNGLTPGAPRKSLGQHFLFDRDLLRRIALAAGPIDGRTVVEIGPGPGGLTRALLEAGVGILIAVETDERFAAGLRDWPETLDGRLVVHTADAREVDEATLIMSAGGRLPAMIVANLPYNVGTPLLVRWLKSGAHSGEPWRGVMVLMFQKEVALRICAAPGDEHYGRLAVLTRSSMRPRIAMTLPPGAFRPPPKVDSAVVVLEPLAEADAFPDADGLEIVAAAAFNQRRKMLRSSLKALAATAGTTADALLSKSGIEATRRAETLTQAEFRSLALAWRQASST